MNEIYERYRHSIPAVRDIPEFMPVDEFAGIRAITYESVPRHGLRTKTFAYLGLPNIPAETTVPGIVLVHGGDGHPFLPWVKMWVERGYAALALENTGAYPDRINAAPGEVWDPGYTYGLHGVFAEEGYTDTPGNDEMANSDAPLEDQWMYHALCQCSGAISVLAACPGVDPARIGITGVSWGGVITSLLLGYEDRLAFAIPEYGSGYLEQAGTWIKDDFAGAETQRLWSAADRFDRVSIPVLWQCWNDDCCFSPWCVSRSWEDTVGNNPETRLSIVHNMFHSHRFCWGRPEPMAFADMVVRNGRRLPRFLSQPTAECLDCQVESEVTFAATLYYLTDLPTYSMQKRYGIESTYLDQPWHSVSLPVTDGRISGTLPKNARLFYITVEWQDMPVILVSSKTVLR